MSVQALSAVLDHSTAKHGARLTAISLANHADKHGITWPSIRLAMEESLLKRRGVQDGLKDLRKRGELVQLVKACGKTHRPPLHWIRLPGLSGAFVREGGAERYFDAFGWELQAEAEEVLADLEPGADSAPGPGADSAPGSGANPAPGPGVDQRKGGVRKAARAPYREPSTENRQCGVTPDVAEPLREVAETKNAVLDDRAVERAIAAYPDRDHAGEAEGFAAWHKPGGRGEHAELRSVALGFRGWLKRAAPSRPELTALPGGGEGEEMSEYGRKVVRSG